MISREVKNVKNLKVYYSTNVAVSYDTTTEEVKIHPKYSKPKIVGLGIKTFLKIIKRLKRYEESGMDSTFYINHCLEEFNL